MITFHPTTLENFLHTNNLNVCLKPDTIKDKILIFTLPNSDTDGRVIIDLIKDYVKKIQIELDILLLGSKIFFTFKILLRCSRQFIKRYIRSTKF